MCMDFLVMLVEAANCDDSASEGHINERNHDNGGLLKTLRTVCAV